MYRNNDTKKIATNAVHKALKAGTLIKEPCAECGEIKVEAHHRRGYAREHWLDIIWYCRKHHNLNHRTRDRLIREQLILKLYKQKVIPESIAVIFNTSLKTINRIIKNAL